MVEGMVAKSKADPRDVATSYAALESQIRAEVTTQYAERFAKAGFWERLRLRWKIEREVRRRLDEILY